MIFTFLNFPGLFAFSDFSDIFDKEIKINAAADSALFWRLPEKEMRFRDVVKKFPKNYTILASEIVVLGRVSSVFSGAKFKKVKNTSDTDIFFK